MRRVMIVGMSGAGKSTLCRAIADKFGLARYHLDNIYHLPGWTARPEDEVRQDFDDIASREAWVVDGNYRRMSGALQERADFIVFLDSGRFYSIFQILKRFALHRLGIKRRVDLAAGFNEKMSISFIMWVWKWPSQNKQRWLTQLAPYGDKVKIFDNRRDVRAWLESL